MRPFEQRIIHTARAPHDIAELNRRIIIEKNILALPNEFELDFVDSWYGVMGQFEGTRVEVEPELVSHNGRNVGYLGMIKVVEVDIPNTWEREPKSRVYTGCSIVAELEHRRLWGSVETSDVVLAVPNPVSRTSIKRATFTRVKH